MLKKQDLGNRWLPEILENHYTFAGELYYCNEATHNNLTDLEFLLGKKTVRLKKGDPDYEPIKKFEFTDSKITIITEEPDEIEKEISEMKTFQIILPVMEYSWERYHSELNNAGSITLLSKEVANKLELTNQPQTFDLFDKNGNKATINLQYENGFDNIQHFVYIRKDLLDKYLEESKLKLVQAIWGEREINFKENILN